MFGTARKIFEWLGETPKYQWTLTNNPLIKKAPFTDKTLSLPLSRGARLVERAAFFGWAYGAYAGAGIIAGMVGFTAGAPLTLAVLGPALFNLKANAMFM